LLNRRRPQNGLLENIGDVFQIGTIKEYRALWRNTLTDEGISEGQRQRFARMEAFSPEEMFAMLDLDKDGSVTPGEVKDLLASRGIVIN
jgi:hypothetical protein